MDRVAVLQLMGDLDNAYSQKAVIEMDKKKAIDSVLTPAVKAELEGIEMEFSEDLDIADQLIKDREQAVKEAVIQYGQGVKDEFLNVTRSEGRVTYDANFLDRLIVDLEGKNPEVVALLRGARKQGKPFASIRKVQ